MPPTITAVADGALPHGSFEITMLETFQIFVADNFKFDNNAKKIQSLSRSGRASRHKVIPTDSTGSADFQIPDILVPAPSPRETFAVDADQDGVVEPYQVEKSGGTFTSDDAIKSTVSIYAMVNPLIYDSVTLRDLVLPAATHAVALVATNALAAFLPRNVVLGATPWTATGLPAGVAIAAATGVISGTPGGVAATYIVKIKCAGTIVIDGVSETRVGVRTYVWVVA
jgi:hypothetical protein